MTVPEIPPERYLAILDEVESGVYFLDLDRFIKSVNDTRGHEVGDHMLRLVSGTLRANVRPFDEIARWGGDEFVVVCPNVDLELLTNLGDRLRVLVEKSVVAREGWIVTATVSVGATLGLAGDTVESLVACADAAMYEAKDGGRNRVAVR